MMIGFTLGFIQNVGWMELLCVFVMLGIVIWVIQGVIKMTVKQAVKQGQVATTNAAGGVAGVVPSHDVVERALSELLAQADSQGFVIVEAVGPSLGGARPFVQFIHSGDMNKGLIVDLPTVNLDAMQAAKAEEKFAAMLGWRAGEAHQAFAGRHAGTAAKIGRDVLAGVYGIGAEVQLGVRRG
jgi:hypothetical protein